jgi:hypothetical protein
MNQKAVEMLSLVVIISGFLPVASANPDYDAFPNVTQFSVTLFRINLAVIYLWQQL